MTAIGFHRLHEVDEALAVADPAAIDELEDRRRRAVGLGTGGAVMLLALPLAALLTWVGVRHLQFARVPPDLAGRVRVAPSFGRGQASLTLQWRF